MSELSGMFCGVADGGTLGIYASKDFGPAITTDAPLKVTQGAGQSAEAPATLTTATGDVKGKMFVENDVCTFKVQNQIFGGVKAPLVDNSPKR